MISGIPDMLRQKTNTIRLDHGKRAVTRPFSIITPVKMHDIHASKTQAKLLKSGDKIISNAAANEKMSHQQKRISLMFATALICCIDS
jgi:hypothetical protein